MLDMLWFLLKYSTKITSPKSRLISSFLNSVSIFDIMIGVLTLLHSYSGFPLMAANLTRLLSEYSTASTPMTAYLVLPTLASISLNLRQAL
jgi:hypothetical protein